MKYILVNYNFTPTWLLEYTDDYLIYDRSESKEYLKDFDQSKIIYTENIGNVDYDKLRYLVDNYDTLPDVFVWGKTNLFKYISKEEFEAVKDNTTFTPLLTMHHKTYSDKLGVVCAYRAGMYYERADSWFFGSNDLAKNHFLTWQQWVNHFRLPNEPFIPFPPGGNFLLTRERVHKYSRDYYEEMRDTLPYAQLPVEAHCAERSYYLMWK